MKHTTRVVVLGMIVLAEAVSLSAEVPLQADKSGNLMSARLSFMAELAGVVMEVGERGPDGTWDGRLARRQCG